MSFDALANRGEYLSAYYLAEVLPRDLKKKDEGLLARWALQENKGRETPRVGIRALRREYLVAKAELADLGDEDKRREPLRNLHTKVLERLGYRSSAAVSPREPRPVTVERAGREHQVLVAHAEPGITVIECGWAVDPDAVTDPDDAGRLLYPVELDRRDRIDAGFTLAGWLFSADQHPPRYVLILSGAVLTLADRLTWGEGRYLSVSLDAAFARNDTRAAGELDVIAALFSADSLRPPAAPALGRPPQTPGRTAPTPAAAQPSPRPRAMPSVPRHGPRPADLAARHDPETEPSRNHGPRGPQRSPRRPCRRPTRGNPRRPARHARQYRRPLGDLRTS